MFENQRRLATEAAVEARRVRSELNIDPMSPIDPVQVAESCGCKVWFKRLTSLEGVYAPGTTPTIILGSERPAGRRAFNCCHELGHHVFNHGYRMEELESQKKSCGKPPDEYLADMFAAFILMPQMAVRKTVSDRGWNFHELTPENIYRLATYFGVGYTSIINHLAFSLKLINPSQAKLLSAVQPKVIKQQYNVGAGCEIVFVDHFWKGRAVDLEVGDTLILPPDAKIDTDHEVECLASMDGSLLCKATEQGITRAYSDKLEWAVNIRVSRKGYDGLAQYRFLSDSEE